MSKTVAKVRAQRLLSRAQKAYKAGLKEYSNILRAECARLYGYDGRPNQLIKVR